MKLKPSPLRFIQAVGLSLGLGLATASAEPRTEEKPQAPAEAVDVDMSLAGAAIQALASKGDTEVLALLKDSGGTMALTPENARKFIRKALDQGLISKDDAKKPDAALPAGKTPDLQQVGPALQALAAAGDEEATKLLADAAKTGSLPLTPESASALIERATKQGLLNNEDDPAASPPDAPMLWKVTGKSLAKPSYLFGTIHVATPRTRKFHPAAQKAFDAADVIVTEVPMSPEAQLRGQPLLMHGESKLSERLDEETYESLDKALKAINPCLTPKPFESLKTWAVAYQLIMLPYQIKHQMQLDQIIWNRAADAGKTTLGADTIENQYTAFDVLTEEEQIMFLKSAIEQSGSEENPHDKLLAYYEKGDKKRIREMMKDDSMLGLDDSEEQKAVGEKLNRKLLTERDQRMTANIARMLETDPGLTHFIALGTAHFLGEESISGQLKALGYTVEPVEN